MDKIERSTYPNKTETADSVFPYTMLMLMIHKRPAFRYTITIVLCCALIAFSCSEKGETEPQKVELVETKDSIQINAGVFQMAMKFPLNEMMDCSPEHKLNENTGDYEITCGEEFGIHISQVDLTVADFKTHFAKESAFPLKAFDEGNNYLVYQIPLPDGSPNYYHLFATKTMYGMSFTFKSTANHDWSEQQIRRMLGAVETINTIHTMEISEFTGGTITLFHPVDSRIPQRNNLKMLPMRNAI